MAVKLADITLDLNADCAEFCPAPHNQHILAAGTYQLDEATNTRHGRMYLYDVSEVSVQPLDWPAPAMPGIFDLKWMNTSDHASSLALALADGTVHIHALQQEGEDARASGIAEVSSCRASDDAMCLMVEASHQPSLSSSSSPLSTMSGSALVVSNSSGTLSLIQVGAGGCALQQEWQAHSLETWCATFDPGQPHLVYSGSDDCSFKGWDLRQEQPSPVFVNSKSHGAGVCIVSPHPSRTQLLATGSYDECIRLWDARNMARPLVAAERAAGGGVWRLKWHPADPHLLLAACMYGGFAVARCATAFDSVEVVETYVAHGSIAYGADWFQGAQLPAWAAERAAAAAGGAGRVEDGCGRSMVATCSFYDKLLHVWLPKTTAEMTAVATSARPPSA